MARRAIRSNRQVDEKPAEVRPSNLASEPAPSRRDEVAGHDPKIPLDDRPSNAEEECVLPCPAAVSDNQASQAIMGPIDARAQTSDMAIVLQEEAFRCRELAAYENGRLLNCLTFHFIQGAIGIGDHVNAARRQLRTGRKGEALERGLEGKRRDRRVH